MDNRPIGVFDSGLGGLAVVKQLKAVLPDERIVYFGDTGRTPYGTKSVPTLHRCTAQICNFLLRHDVKMIVAACGTVSSTVTEEFVNSLPVPFLGIIEPTARAAAAATESGHVGVIGTDATVKSRSFERELKQQFPARVTARACPLFVSLVENGYIDPENPTALGVAEEYLSFIKGSDIDTLILGCTHFPLLAPIIQKIAGQGVTLIDPGVHTSAVVRDILTEKDLLCEKRTAPDSFYVSDRGQLFGEIAGIFMGYDISEQVQTESVSALPAEISEVNRG